MRYIITLAVLSLLSILTFTILFLTGEGPTSYMPHGACFVWRKDILVFNVIGNSLTALSYFLIPGYITAYIRHKKDTLQPQAIPIAWLFAAFILACGLGHILNVWNIWNGDYHVDAIWQTITGLVSLFTVTILATRFSDIKDAPTANDVHKQYEIAELHRLSSFDAVLVHEHGVVREANEAAINMFKMSRKELINSAPLVKLVSPEDLLRVQKRIEGGLTGPYKLTILPADSSDPAYTIVNANEVKHNGRTVRVTVVRDVTETVELKAEVVRLKQNIKDLEQIQKIKQQIMDQLIAKGGSDGD